ncbi:MAG: GNAT family N-acetyltransferase [Verrucomicrobium sp.]|nr:GNAT family N-acetyltransferase [Verrucomicrobium sp.]
MIRTPRLLLRPWRESDLEPYAALNADPAVREFLGPPLTREQSDFEARRTQGHLERYGFGFWAVEIPDEASFIGFVGLMHCFLENVPFLPAVELAWRLARPHWGKGYATEAAQYALQDGFGRVGLAEAVAFTFEGNKRSRAAMERLGMARNPAEDFNHPNLAAGHPLRPHVLYRLSQPI